MVLNRFPIATRSSRIRRVVAYAAVALFVLSVLALALYRHTRLDQEIRVLPASERRVLYERTRETLRSSCEHVRGPELAEYCRRQADLLQRFPECDRDCRDLAARFTPLPSR